MIHKDDNELGIALRELFSWRQPSFTTTDELLKRLRWCADLCEVGAAPANQREIASLCRDCAGELIRLETALEDLNARVDQFARSLGEARA
jgi:hypothetical protein